MSARSKVIVFRMSVQKYCWGTEDFEINEHGGAHLGKYGNGYI